jgi:hypothetical protein
MKKYQLDFHRAVLAGNKTLMKQFTELGADVNAPMHNDGRSPVYIASYYGYLEAVTGLIEMGANINTARDDGCTPVYIAAREGHFDVVKTLVEHGADVNTPANNGETPLYVAALWRSSDVVLYLVDVGADVTQALSRSMLPVAVLEMLQLFCQRCDVQCSSEMSPLFPLVQLMCSISVAVCNHDDDDAKAVFKTAISCELRQNVASTTVKQMSQVPYPLRRRLTRLACRIYYNSLLIDSDRISLSTKARRYVELMCFLLDEVMMRDALALRLTCRANHEWRRFPFYTDCYRELEAHLIESFIAFDASRFVSTQVINSAIEMHSQHHVV